MDTQLTSPNILNVLLLWVLLLSPLLLGAIIAFSGIDKSVKWVHQVEEWISCKNTESSSQDGVLGIVAQCLFGGLDRIGQWTEGVQSKYVKSGIRATAYIYYIAAFGMLTLCVAIVTVAFYLIWMFLKVSYFVLTRLLEKNSEELPGPSKQGKLQKDNIKIKVTSNEGAKLESGNKCGNCKYALAADAALKFGLISELEYQVYTRSNDPDWPPDRISRIQQAFAVCKKDSSFIKQNETCAIWEYRKYGPDFGQL